MPPFPAVPAPATWADAPVLVSGLRADQGNGVSFLASRPSFSGYCTGTPSVTAGAFRSVVLDTELSDPWQGHSPLGASPQNWYCQAPGWYLAEGYVPWQYTGGTETEFAAAIGVSTAGGLVTYQGQQHVTASGQNPGVFAADLIQMTRTGPPGSSGSDYVQLQAATSGTVSLAGVSPNFPRLSVRWAGTGSASSLAIPVNAAFPVPPAFVDKTWLNANIRDAIGFLENPPMFRRAHLSVIGDMPATTWPAATIISLGGASLDNYGAWSGTAWTVPQPGIYYVYAQVAVSTTTGAVPFAAGYAVNGTVTWGQAVFSGIGPSDLVIAAATGRPRLAAGDTVQLAGYQGTGAPATATAQSRLVICWESA